MPVGYSIYVDRPSYVHHQLDPRTKLAALGAIFVLALAFNHPAVLGGLVLLVLVVGRLAQVGWRRVVPRSGGRDLAAVRPGWTGPVHGRRPDDCPQRSAFRPGDGLAGGADGD